MGLEQRIQRRIPFTQQILINNSLMVNAIDISEGGLYVHTGRMFPGGSIVALVFSIGNQKFNLKAKVQHCQEGVGMGLEFVNLTDEQKNGIKTLLAVIASKKAVSSKKRILVVDGNDLARRMNKSRLILDGFAVLEAKDGIEALKILQAEQLDLVVLDLYMEPMDGFKLTTFIRQMHQHKDIPVIVFSARSTPDVIEQAMNAGATLFLVKMTTSPIKLSENVKSLLK